ncbi:FixH family protein [Ferdinandcohnia quinoae]|uniref:FixH family protein n=1 Tax=Fredinandcohnia quinoae TaxID=2918902 RepID=A0AAW5E751_9BACI|nr:FixH family protein [Fredinandcohnia sp. SECRCQ15]MCH1625226.1 FixH family protein [Fredinandcohnia sp. SECRCQ15]
MRKRLTLILFVMVLAVLSACNKDEDEKVDVSDKSEVPQILDVQLKVPESVDVNGKVEMKAIVTQGSEDVADADEVKFEVWENGKKEESSLIEAKNNKDGTYVAETTFDHDGEFTIQVHVTARGMHTMPQANVKVGTGASHEEEEHHHEHTEGFSMHFMNPSDAKVGNDTTLMVHLSNGEDPLEKANVRYEIWTDKNPDKHEWIDAEETNAGEYTGSYKFPDAGTFTVKVHVENDEGLHEHEEHQVEVGK